MPGAMATALLPTPVDDGGDAVGEAAWDGVGDAVGGACCKGPGPVPAGERCTVLAVSRAAWPLICQAVRPAAVTTNAATPAKIFAIHPEGRGERGCPVSADGCCPAFADATCGSVNGPGPVAVCNGAPHSVQYVPVGSAPRPHRVQNAIPIPPAFYCSRRR